MTEREKKEIVKGLCVYTDSDWTNKLVITLVDHMKAYKKHVPFLRINEIARYSYILGFIDGIEASEERK